MGILATTLIERQAYRTKIQPGGELDATDVQEALEELSSEMLRNLVEDTTPQLGGNLDCLGRNLNSVGVIYLDERAAAEADVEADGQIWVETATPNKLRFTDDAGGDWTPAMLEDLANTASGFGASLIGVFDTAGYFTATTVEGVLAEIWADLISTSTGLGSAIIGIEDAGGYYTGNDVEAALQELGVSLAQLGSPVTLEGSWDASAGTFPGGGAAQAGFTYIVSVTGTVDSVDFTVNDRILAIADNASTTTYASNWLKLDYTDQVLSVAGQTGAVTLAQADISGLTTADSPQFTAIELGAASDTTIARVSAGVVSIEGDQILTASDNLGSVGSAATAFGNIKQAASTTATGVVEKATDAEYWAATADKFLSADLLDDASAIQSLSDAATVAVDWSTFVNGDVTLTANRALGNPSNEEPGQYRTILVKGNDATERTLTFGSEYGGNIPTLTDITSTQFYHLTIYCKAASEFLVTAIDGSDA